MTKYLFIIGLLSFQLTAAPNCFQRFFGKISQPTVKAIGIVKQKSLAVFLNSMEYSVQLFSRNNYEGKLIEVTLEGAKKPLTMKVGKKVAHGFYGVVYHLELQDYEHLLKYKFPQLFDGLGNPRELIIKFPNRIPYVSGKFNIWKTSIREELKEYNQIAKLMDDDIRGAEIVLADEGKNPWLVKPYLSSKSLHQLAKEQDDLSTTQIEALEKLFNIAVSLYDNHGIAIDLKPQNLAWNERSKEFEMYELTYAWKNSRTFINEGFEAYYNMVVMAMRTL